MSEESKRLARQWNREIEAEIRGDAAAAREQDGPWKLVVWLALEALWLVVLLVMLVGLKLLLW